MEMISRLWLMSLQACALILFVLAVRSALKRYPKIWSYSLWILVGVRLLCPVLVESPFSLQPDFKQLTQVEEVAQPDGDLAGAVAADKNQGNTDWDKNVGNAEDTGNAGNVYEGFADSDKAPAVSDGEEKEESKQPDAGMPGGEKNSLFSLKEALAAAYVAGVIFTAGIYFVQYFHMHRKVQTAVKGVDGIWLCEHVNSPFVMGFFKTKIILPYGLSEEESSHILKHEKMHIRHYDPLIRLAGILCICLHWWNPFVWLAVHKMNQDMEMFCDEAVLRNASGEEQKAYANTLLAFSMRQSGFSVGLAFGESNTEKRVKNLVQKRRGNRVLRVLVMLLALFGVLALFTVPRDTEAGSEPTVTPEPTDVPELTDVPEPTVSPEPTAALMPTAAPEPTDVPEMTVTPEPAEENYGSVKVLEGREHLKDWEISLEDWGNVLFSAYLSVDKSDVEFFILQEETVYRLPDLWASNATFLELKEVDFVDYNEDGYKDILVVCEYSDNEEEEIYPKAMIFFRNRESKEFVRNAELMEFLEKNGYDGSITDMLEGQGRWVSYVMSMESGTYWKSFEEQIRIITEWVQAEKMRRPLSNPEEMVRYAVTDFDKDGLFEIVSGRLADVNDEYAIYEMQETQAGMLVGQAEELIGSYGQFMVSQNSMQAIDWIDDSAKLSEEALFDALRDSARHWYLWRY